MTERNYLKKLSALRVERSLSQKAAAEGLNVSPAMLSHYEHGIREPGIDFLLRAAKFYDCSIDYLLGRTNDRRGIPWFPEDMEDGEALTEDELSERSLNVARVMDALTALYANPGLSDALYLYTRTALYRFVRTVAAGGEARFTLRKSPAQNLAHALESRILADSDGSWSAVSEEDLNVPGVGRLKSLVEETEILLKENRL